MGRLHSGEALDRFVQREPWIERDRVMIDVLASIGIEKGKPYGPDAATRASLKSAIEEARAWLEAQYEAAFVPAYFSNSRWAVPASKDVLEGMGTNFGNRDSYPVGGRGVTYTYGFFSAKHRARASSTCSRWRTRQASPSKAVARTG